MYFGAQKEKKYHSKNVTKYRYQSRQIPTQQNASQENTAEQETTGQNTIATE